MTASSAEHFESFQNAVSPKSLVFQGFLRRFIVTRGGVTSGGGADDGISACYFKGTVGINTVTLSLNIELSAGDHNTAVGVHRHSEIAKANTKSKNLLKLSLLFIHYNIPHKTKNRLSKLLLCLFSFCQLLNDCPSGQYAAEHVPVIHHGEEVLVQYVVYYCGRLRVDPDGRAKILA